MKYITKGTILLITLFVFDFTVNASAFSNYTDAVSNTNSYIARFNNYESYIDTTNKYLYNGTLSSKTGFINGGFINTYEFERTMINNDSYLITGSKYWTMTETGSNVYVVNTNKLEAKSKTESYESRITEYVKPAVKVSGDGSRSNPWVFVD